MVSIIDVMYGSVIKDGSIIDVMNGSVIKDGVNHRCNVWVCDQGW